MGFSLKLKEKLINILDGDRVKDDKLTIYSYESDGLTSHSSKPMGVLFPHNTEELIEVVKCLNSFNVTFLPRGAGTGLSGGAIALQESVIIEMVKFNKIYDIDQLNRTITVGPGVINIKVSDAALESGLQFAPDPSSQRACSIGGNVGENAGGPHTLKYGVTVNHVLGLELVLATGEKMTIGGDSFYGDTPDMVGLFIGSEGTFGIVTKVICRLSPLPENIITLLAIFPSINDASQTVSDIISTGMIPAALEMMDNPVIKAIETVNKPGFPMDAEAILIIEIEGLTEEMKEESAVITAIAEKNNAVKIKQAKDATERQAIWDARKGAFSAIGTLSPNYIIQDGVVPRARLPEILAKIKDLGEINGLTVANVFHAGDGNLHPLILYNEQIEGESDKAHYLSQQILEECVNAGGSLTGEHGIGLEKNEMMSMLFNEQDLNNFKQIKNSFDEKNILNPGKIFPSPGKCSEMRFKKTTQGSSNG